jgi:hypothetical protein
MAAKTKDMVLNFKREKITKNTVRFQADGHDAVTYIYIGKGADTKLGAPEAISITIKPV